MGKGQSRADKISILLTKCEGCTGRISARGRQYEHERPRADILPVRPPASLVNKRFITRLKTIVQNILFHKKKKKQIRAKHKGKNNPILTEELKAYSFGIEILSVVSQIVKQKSNHLFYRRSFYL